MIQVATREVEEQILHRRQQHGVEYPQANDGTRSKQITIENLSAYCDINAERYYDAGNGNSTNGEIGSASSTKRQLLKRFRGKARQQFTPDSRRDLFFASVIWIKIDLSKKKPPTDTQVGDASDNIGGSGLAVGAVDIATEALKLNFDFVQLGAINEELTRIGDFGKQTQVRQWRPSCIDRERVAPPVVHVSSTALMPIVLDDKSLLAFPPEKQRRSKRWFREMWQFATWCILVNKRKGNLNLLRFSMQKCASSTLNEETRSRRYVDLYSRNLSQDALRMIVFGKKLLFPPKSPQKPTDQHQEPPLPAVPSLEPLTREEQWELSDMILHFSVTEQRKYRSKAEDTLRSFKNKSSAPPSPAKFAAEAPHSPMSTSTTPTSPVSQLPPTSPLGSPSKTSTRLPDLPTDYVANHHHITRSSTESALQPKKHPLSPTLSLKPSQSHPASTDVQFGKKVGGELSPSRKLTTPALKHQWIQEVFLPASLLKKAVPFFNWNLGPISLCIFRDNSSRSSPESPTKSEYSDSSKSPVAPPKPSSGDGGESPRCEFLKIGFERCSGSFLFSSSPIPLFLIEVRLGLFHATLFSPSHQSVINHSTRNNSISSDYIKDPEDGFLYVGLKYNCKDGSHTAAGAEHHQQHWDLKGKVCAGPIKIDYNELTLQTSLATTANVPLSSKLVPHASYSLIVELPHGYLYVLQRVSTLRPRRTSQSSSMCTEAGASSISASRSKSKGQW